MKNSIILKIVSKGENMDYRAGEFIFVEIGYKENVNPDLFYKFRHIAQIHQTNAKYPGVDEPQLYVECIKVLEDFSGHPGGFYYLDQNTYYPRVSKKEVENKDFAKFLI
jgi:hypothetical protein